jgi:hypothetical protein
MMHLYRVTWVALNFLVVPPLVAVIWLRIFAGEMRWAFRVAAAEVHAVLNEVRAHWQIVKKSRSTGEASAALRARMQQDKL